VSVVGVRSGWPRTARSCLTRNTATRLGSFRVACWRCHGCAGERCFLRAVTLNISVDCQIGRGRNFFIVSISTQLKGLALVSTLSSTIDRSPFPRWPLDAVNILQQFAALVASAIPAGAAPPPQRPQLAAPVPTARRRPLRRRSTSSRISSSRRTPSAAAAPALWRCQAPCASRGRGGGGGASAARAARAARRAAARQRSRQRQLAPLEAVGPKRRPAAGRPSVRGADASSPNA
jgi:hypothetical protein